DVVACRRRVRRSREIRLRQRHRVNRKARAMRRESKRDKGHRKTRKLTPVVIGGNVSGTHPYSADDAGACDPACHASMPQRSLVKAGQPSARVSRRCSQSLVAKCIEECVAKK
ncbi:hypothetical protein DD788_31075, partial [Ralstonia pickettii]|nr:hypothetical protein [Ralstonia pickettii]